MNERKRFAKFMQLLNEIRESHPDAMYEFVMQTFADKVGLPVYDIKSYNTARKPISTSSARRMEVKCGKPEGWMDE